jgi:hypothetical protein
MNKELHDVKVISKKRFRQGTAKQKRERATTTKKERSVK